MIQKMSMTLLILFLGILTITNGSKYDINCDIDSEHSCLWSEVRFKQKSNVFYVDFVFLF